MPERVDFAPFIPDDMYAERRERGSEGPNREPRCAHGFRLPAPTASALERICPHRQCPASVTALSFMLPIVEEKLRALELCLQANGKSAHTVPRRAGKLMDTLEAIDAAQLTPDELERVETLCDRAEALEGLEIDPPKGAASDGDAHVHARETR